MEGATALGHVITAHMAIPDPTTVVMAIAGTVTVAGMATAGVMDTLDTATAGVMATGAATAIDPGYRLDLGTSVGLGGKKRDLGIADPYS